MYGIKNIIWLTHQAGEDKYYNHPHFCKPKFNLGIKKDKILILKKKILHTALLQSSLLQDHTGVLFFSGRIYAWINFHQPTFA